jgi:hypothetical protein
LKYHTSTSTSVLSSTMKSTILSYHSTITAVVDIALWNYLYVLYVGFGLNVGLDASFDNWKWNLEREIDIRNRKAYVTHNEVSLLRIDVYYK